MYTKQQVFDISCLQIIRQNYQRCVGPSGYCSYSMGGRMCAAGPFVVNKGSANGVLTRDPDGTYLVRLTVGDEMRPLLGDLQDAHDFNPCSGIARWENVIRSIAREHDLSAGVLRSRDAFTHRPFGTVGEAIKFAQEVDPSLDFEGLAFDSVEEVREHVIYCWEDFEAPTYDGRVL